MLDLAEGLAALVAERAAHPGLIFVDRRDEAKALAEELEHRLGIETVHVTAALSKAQRARIAERMQSGELKLAVCTAAWSTGIDIPRLRYVILAGRGKAPICALQSVGRALRLKENGAGFEVLNISTKATRRNAAQREALLGQYGFEIGQSEDRFLDALATQPQDEECIDWPQTIRNIIGPAWLVVLILLLCFLCGVIDYTK